MSDVEKSNSSIKKFVVENEYSERQIKSKFREVYDLVLSDSKCVKLGNFVNICPNDAQVLFEGYDKIYFDGGIKKMLGNAPLKFRFSKRMTRVAGTTEVRKQKANGHASYEIAFAIDMLYQNFKEGDRTIEVNGLQCSNRLEAMQRVMEHEIVHLIEYLIWTDSSCAQKRFHSIAKRFFGHSHYKHALITRKERAKKILNITVGTQVSFEHQGQRYVGVINRINKRATVLVKDPKGKRYTDGNCYQKFYMPLTMLQRIS
ncbi:MAG: SprT-like domain-containing protein [Gammaproteobacteria bacterium WSBS_2016_MAG_OTU1]